ncbi:MAG: HEPN domain-containing protein [Proteobacteria bacterium]|nr:HEPN domain-containing protein [Pseudomonadota bacterium]
MRSVPALMDKADRSLKSARLLLREGDPDGAANRLYYALRSAASAALVHCKVPVPKTHGALIAAFGQHVVSPGLISPAQGRLLNRLEQRRLIADYTAESLEPAMLEKHVTEAEAFIAAIRAVISA